MPANPLISRRWPVMLCSTMPLDIHQQEHLAEYSASCSEFSEGFEGNVERRRAAAIFGSARTRPEDPYYLAAEGYRQAAGPNPVFRSSREAGPASLEAGNKGAIEGQRHKRGSEHHAADGTGDQTSTRPSHWIFIFLRA